jgi:hypothetical protein
MSDVRELDTDGLWETYHHISKLSEIGQDERGNTWSQDSYGKPAGSSATGWGIHHGFVAADELCGTAQCFAGWYVTLQGMAMNGRGIVLAGTQAAPVADVARRHAGLTDLDVVRLFCSFNTLADIAGLLVDITGEDRR